MDPKPETELREIVLENPIATDAMANREAVAISSGEDYRYESTQKHLHWGIICLFWMAVSWFVALASVWAYHLVTHVNLHFLSKEQIDKVQTIVFSAVGSSLATEVARKKIFSKS